MLTLEKLNTIKLKDKELLIYVKQTIHQFIPTAEIYLYGSVARGSQNPESDYDLLVLMDIPLSSEEENNLQKAIYDIELSYGVLISLVLYTREQWNQSLITMTPFHKNIVKESVLI